ncbi:phage head-binding domain-containing protein [Erwinia sp. P6884]|uniref:phage head-binding domain-containing protein n=1 Tax=Erwinia sp. P6884 TaxID=3141450 RepID=UPI0031977D93
MADITANVVVSMPSQLFTASRSFKALANGRIFIGVIDKDPTIPANQIQVYIENEDGGNVPIAQPIIINAAGFPVYGGQIVKLVTVSGHAMAVYDAYGSLEHYFPNVLNYDPARLDRRLSSTEDGDGDALIGVKQPVSGSLPRTQHDVNAERISALDLGLKYVGMDGASATENRENIHTAMAVCAASGKTLYVPDGVYEFDNCICIGVSNLAIEFSYNAKFVLTHNTYKPSNPMVAVGGFLFCGYDKDLNTANVTDISLIRPQLNCSSLVGENAFSGIGVQRLVIDSPIMENCVYTSENGGGKGFHFEGNIAKDIIVKNPVIRNSSIGFAAQGAPNGSKVSAWIQLISPKFENVNIPFMLYAQYNNPETNNPTTMSIFASDVVAHNCGAVSGFGSATAGGIICSDRGGGLVVNGIFVANDLSYNSIGSFFRGSMFGVRVYKARLYTSSAVSIIDHTPVGFGSPSNAEHVSDITSDIECQANLDYIFKGVSGAQFGNHKIECTLNFSVATLAGICDPAAGASNSALAEIINQETGLRTGWRKFKNLFDSGNSAGVARRYDAQGTWTPVDSSVDSLPLTLNGSQTYTRNGDVVTCILDITYPSTSGAGLAQVSGLPFTSASSSSVVGGILIALSSELSLNRGVVSSSGKTARFFAGVGQLTNATLSGDRIQAIITYIAGE